MSTAIQVEVKEKPILFSAAMVRAILEGRKTQTRRVIVPQPERDPFPCHYVYSGYSKSAEPNEHGHSSCTCREIKCRYAADRLWVRETWAPHDNSVLANQERDYVYYRADDEAKYETDGAWRPSIHMPRWASRIILEVRQIRAERLQAITIADVEAEGIARERFNGSGVVGIAKKFAHHVFAEEWNKLNAKRGYSWESNPFVWVISFKKLCPQS